MEALFLGFSVLEDLVRDLAAVSKVFASEEAGDGFSWHRFLTDKSTRLTLGPYRPAQPLKSFLFPSRQTVAEYPSSPRPGGDAAQVILLGVKACDLHSLAVMDHVFLGDGVRDPFYASRRENTLVVASDCTDLRDSCFCTAVGLAPFPQAGHDLCLSPVAGGWLATPGSARGEAFLQARQGAFAPATQAQLDEQQARRDSLAARLRARLEDQGVPGQEAHRPALLRNMGSPLWEREAADCVECGACNLVCPTCHCFVLQDYEREAAQYGRARLWDSCQYKGFARVAGGANPRKRLAERVRNRFVKKFDFFPATAGIAACTGCGRCIEACIAKIDIREILKELASA